MSSMLVHLMARLPLPYSVSNVTPPLFKAVIVPRKTVPLDVTWSAVALVAHPIASRLAMAVTPQCRRPLECLESIIPPQPVMKSPEPQTGRTYACRNRTMLCSSPPRDRTLCAMLHHSVPMRPGLTAAAHLLATRAPRARAVQLVHSGD